MKKTISLVVVGVLLIVAVVVAVSKTSNKDYETYTCKVRGYERTCIKGE